MIFVTVGAQMPFDRLITAVDRWAARHGRDDVFAQIGQNGAEPKHVEWTHLLDPSEVRRHIFESDLVVAHAGMGTILTAFEFGKPIVMMPRRASLRETRNDHQFATSHAMAETTGIAVAWDENELPTVLDAASSLPAPSRAGSQASVRLLTAVGRFIDGDDLPKRHIPAVHEREAA